jgi:nitrogen fixation protein FixH
MARMIDTPTTPAAPGEYRLTGRHVLIWLICFFGVVFAVNFTMMHYAVSTFSGMEDDSPYKNGLAYNTDLDAGRRQNARGWTVNAGIERQGDGLIHVAVDAVDAKGVPLSGLEGTLRLERPADRRFDRSGPLTVLGTGRYGADLGPADIGQWDLVVELDRGGEKLFVSRNRVILK